MVMVLVASASVSKCGVMVSATEPSSLTLAEAATASVAVEHRRLGDRVDGERDGLAGGVGGGCALGGVRLHGEREAGGVVIGGMQGEAGELSRASG